MSLYTKFCAWLSGWPESVANASDGRSHHEEDLMFAEETKKKRIREGKKPKGLNPKKTGVKGLNPKKKKKSKK